MKIRILGVENARAKPAAPTTIAVAMMVGNDRKFIDVSVRSALAVADDVVVLDTGSTDGTGERAAELGARVVREDRMVDLGDGLRAIDDFAAARNRAIELASAGGAEWVCVLDADEELHAPALRRALEIIPAGVEIANVLHNHVDLGEWQDMPNVFRACTRPRYQHRLHETLCTWLGERTRGVAHLPQEVAYVAHHGTAPTTRERNRREERNRKILDIMFRENPNDPHALYYAARMVAEILKGAA